MTIFSKYYPALKSLFGLGEEVEKAISGSNVEKADIYA